MEDVGERIDSPMPAPASHFPQSYQTAAEQQFYSNQPFFHTQYVPPMYTHTPTTHVGRNRGPQESMINRPGFPTKAPARGGRARFQPEDDERLKWLKEKAPVKMSWEQIAEFFPGRKSGTLQVRYCTKLKEKGPIDWNDELVSSPASCLFLTLTAVPTGSEAHICVQRVRRGEMENHRRKGRPQCQPCRRTRALVGTRRGKTA